MERRPKERNADGVIDSDIESGFSVLSAAFLSVKMGWTVVA
jgi:hypothetical protein